MSVKRLLTGFASNAGKLDSTPWRGRIKPVVVVDPNDSAPKSRGNSMGARHIIGAYCESGRVASLPHMRHFYATVLPRLAKAPILTASSLETRDVANISFPDSVCNAGRVGSLRDYRDAGGASSDVLGRQGWLALGGHILDFIGLSCEVGCHQFQPLG
jgi:hypothetical protein